jgi:hypothetical protein
VGLAWDPSRRRGSLALYSATFRSALGSHDRPCQTPA